MITLTPDPRRPRPGDELEFLLDGVLVDLFIACHDPVEEGTSSPFSFAEPLRRRGEHPDWLVPLELVASPPAGRTSLATTVSPTSLVTLKSSSNSNTDIFK